MLLSSLALAFQVTVSVGPENSGVRTGATDDTTGRRAPRRIEVTEEHLRTAFKDASARTLLMRARAARLTQDSALLSYQAKSYQRISVGMSLRETARQRLAFRTENAARVRWHRDAGARVEVLGARSAVPFSKEAEQEMRGEFDDMLAIPYYPGKEPLIALSNTSMVRAEVDERSMVHPLATGSEAYYTFASGDSVLMTLPDGKRILLRELRIAAREPRWNVTVGSFWFDVERGHLVRAVYRMSTQMNIWATVEAEDPGSMDDVPIWVKGLITPMLADITAMSVEYGLQEQRFWMPKLQALEGYARVGFLRVPLKVEERYQYESVNALEPMAPIPASTAMNASEVRDSLRAVGLDSAEVRQAMREYYAARDSSAKAERERQCSETGLYTTYRRRYEGSLPLAIEMPCDTVALARSSELPPSIYDEGEELFGARERDELVKALTMGLQPGWGPQKPRTEWGLAYTRFNRVEGFSTGGAVKTTLGSGYETELQLRGSAADLQLNGELAISRSNGRSQLRGAVYRRLAVSSDFGDPLSFGASLPAFFYARDEGFYHRAWGAEVRGTRPMRGGLDWRVFAEEQFTATVENRWSMFGGANDDRFVGNLPADQGWYYGTAARWRASKGLDPRGWRASADLRVEAATGASDFTRGMLETVVSRGLGPVAASVTGAAGTTGGTLPAQRQFFLGGLHSIRGQTAGTAIGESFWMGRLEVGRSSAGVRPVIFGDIGWAGARDGWSAVGRPMSGVGVGSSFLDGMIRIDLARGIHPRWQTRLDLYLEARF